MFPNNKQKHPHTPGRGRVVGQPGSPKLCKVMAAHCKNPARLQADHGHRTCQLATPKRSGVLSDRMAVGLCQKRDGKKDLPNVPVS